MKHATCLRIHPCGDIISLSKRSDTATQPSAGDYCCGNSIGHSDCSYYGDEAAAEDDDGVIPKNLCRKWSRLKTRPQPTLPILIKSSRFIRLSEEKTHHSHMVCIHRNADIMNMLQMSCDLQCVLRGKGAGASSRIHQRSSCEIDRMQSSTGSSRPRSHATSCQGRVHR